jgi:branched-chain amino acid transport system ATP-binding protein
MSPPLLSIQHLSVSYGPVAALREVSLEAEPGEIVAVLGANGAGKTTLLRTISGLLRPRSGSVHLDGRDLTRLPAHAIARAGVAHVPEGRGILGRMSVEENLRMGAFHRRDRAEVERDLADTYQRFPILAERRQQPAALLSGGQQQMLAIARAWLARPLLMLLDEPSLGLAPMVLAEVFRMIGAMRSERSAVVLVEQNTTAALRLADRAAVLQLGRVVLADRAAALLEDAGRLAHVYLGQRGAGAVG